MQERLRDLWSRVLSSRQRTLVVALACLVVGYAIVGFLVVPWIARRQIHTQAAARLAREASVAKVRFNPFTLETRLIGFDLRDRDGSPLVAFDTLAVNLQLMSLVERAWVLKEIRLVRPQVVARILQDGKPAIADLFESPSAAPAPEDTVPAHPLRLKVYLSSILSGRVEFVDESRTPRHTEQFEDLGLTLEEFSTLPQEEGSHFLTVRFHTGAEIKWSGTNVMEPLDLNGRFELSRLRLPRISQILGERLPLTITEGLGNVAFSYDVAKDPDKRITLAVSDASMELTGLALRPKDAKTDWVKVSQIEARGLKVRWPERTANLDLFRIGDPWVTATRLPDSTLNWAPYLAAGQAGDSTKGPVAAPAAADTAPPWTATVGAIELVDGALHLEDRIVAPAFVVEVSKIQVRLDSVATDPRIRTGVTASLAVGKKATFAAEGSVVRQPFAADLDLDLADLGLVFAQPYFGANPPLHITSGAVSTKGKLRLRDTKPKTLFEGTAGLDAIVINDSANAPLLNLKSTRIRGIRLTSEPDLLRIKKIDVVQPFARIAISKDRQFNLAPLASLAPQSSSEKKFPYEISEVLIKDAEIDFSDESLILPFRTRIHSTEGTIRDIASFGGTPGTLELAGKIDEYGLARANGTLHVSDPYASTNIKAEFRNVDMPGLTPYTAEFLGYAIREGRLDVDMDYRVQNRELHAEHHVVVKNLHLGDKVEGGEGGPPGFVVKLAVSLLKDRQGNIKLDPLVEGTVDSPEFSYKKIVWQAVKQILGKIVTAPFRALGRLLGLGGDAPELVDFDPGSTEVIPPEREKLDSLAAEMAEKPELTLSIEGRYDSISDAAALREAKLKAQVEAKRDSTVAKTQKADTGTTVLGSILENLYLQTFSREALDSLRTAFTASATNPSGEPAKESPKKETKKKAQAPPPPPPASGFNAAGYYDSLRAQLMAAQPVDPAELTQLGRDRAGAISAALAAAGLTDSSRVTVTDPAPVKKKKAGSPRVPSEMSMDAK